MSHSPAVVFDHVWKRFHRGERHDSIKDLIPALARRAFGRVSTDELESPDDFWAVKDVSFEVGAGEALGIIGPNGAGKSTTLKLLTKILRPTKGTCAVHGRVGALIEVAAGFHPDLTGRENVFLQGAIMGMKRVEIVNRLDAIVDFAGVRDFIDTPVKRYSSGMNARLGFSVAAHLNPDVLIIDEVLSVGDIAFQERCIERMHEFRRQGVTIVFVSHNLQAVAALCSTALCLKSTMVAYGPPDETIRHYVEGIELSQRGPDNLPVQITDAQLLNADGRRVEAVHPRQQLRLRVSYVARETIEDFELGFLVHRSNDGLLAHAQGFSGPRLPLRRMEAGVQYRIEFAFTAHLTRGHYHLECHAFHRPTQQHVGRLRPAGLFHVQELDTWGGVADLDVTCGLAAPVAGSDSVPHLMAARV